MSIDILKSIFKIGIIMILLDSVYLSTFKNHFNNVVNKIQGEDIDMDIIAALLCYICLVIGLYYFIIKENKTYIDAFILGVVIYGVFEFTTKAIFKKWDYFSVVLDTTWGGILFALTTKLYQLVYM